MGGGGVAKTAAMMLLFFLVVCAMGILRPIRNALALDGLSQTDFYKVYLVSAIVILFVPLYNRLSDWVPRRWLIPAVALFFATNLLVFRAFYAEGSTAFGLMFYGWYDLFAAALVTQFFMTTQMFFDARLARRAYPLVIAGGSIGAALGGAVTGFLAERVGTPNLMIVAAALIAAFSAGMPFVWKTGVPETPRRPRRHPAAQKLTRGDLRDVFANRQVQLIAGMVLITVLVKQIVDYEFNTLTKEVFEDRDAISAFQGKFNAATQWLPIAVLAALRPLLTRFGIGLAVLLLPIAMLTAGVGLVVFFGLAAAVTAKAAETGLRYSAERAGREILYVPIPDEIKLKAKTYIDVAIEKGVGKVASAGLIFVLLAVMDFRGIAAVAVVLSAVWVAMALGARREYVRALSAAVEGRFASLRGVFTSLADASTVPVLKRSLAGDPSQVAFALDLIDEAPAREADPLAPTLLQLTGHESPAIRARAFEQLARSAYAVPADMLRDGLRDAEPSVREAAVRAMFAARPREEAGLMEQLLASTDASVRSAALSCLARGEIGEAGHQVARRVYAERTAMWGGSGTDAPADARVELALAAVAMDADGTAAAMLEPLVRDADPRVASAALQSAGRLSQAAPHEAMIGALRRPATREAARGALAAHGTVVLPSLTRRLLDRGTDAKVRRAIPSVLARIPSSETVRALIECALSPETEQILDFRALKALSKLRARNAELAFEPRLVHELIAREIGAARHYAAALAALHDSQRDAAARLLAQALGEAWAERREGAFRAIGLLFPPDDVYRCYLAVVCGERVPRANALEWLESTLGHRLFAQLDPVLRESPEPARPGVPTRRMPRGVGLEDAASILESLRHDEDGWVGRCAAKAAAQLLPPAAGGWEGGVSPDAELGPTRAGASVATNTAMDPVEKVLLLQKVDVLRGARSAHLALLAAIADEMDVDAGTVLVRAGETTDALYVVIRGSVTLRGADGEITASNGTAFGAWALIDEAPSVIEARADGPAHLLRISRPEFYELLADYPELAIGLLQGLARRMRTLVG